ncbi:MAG: SPFH domain-containing protein [Burkholderiales bacterium]
MEIWLGALFAAIVVIAIFYVISIWVYKHAPANMGFIRTGFMGTKVCLGKGAMVLPVFHEVSWISLETLKLIVDRSREQAVSTADKIRIDLVAELYTHVGRTEADLLTASRSLGEKTFDANAVHNLLEAKVVGAARSYAATKTLTELHENRDAFAQALKEAVRSSFRSNGLELEEVTVVTLEQTDKQYLDASNIFDAEGLKIITEITSEARRKVHDTEKRTTLAIRQKDLDTQLDLLEIERREAFAHAVQEKEVANEQAMQLGQKQVFLLDQRRAVEEREIANEVELERQRTGRALAITEEAQKRERAEVHRRLALEQEERDKQIALIQKARQEELANIERNLALERAEKDRQIALIAKAKEEELAEIERSLSRERAEKSSAIELAARERERREAEIIHETAVLNSEEAARDDRHQVSEEIAIRIRRRALDTKKHVLDIDQEEATSVARQDRAVAEEKARALSEKQRILLEKRLEVERDEIAKEQAIEEARIARDAELIDASKAREAAEIRRQLAREIEERDRQIALVGKQEELEQAELQQRTAIALAQQDGEIRIIAKEQERERADIQRFLARETEERDREIAMVQKTRELEQAEIGRLRVTAEKAKAEHDTGSVRVIADAEQDKAVELIRAEKAARSSRIAEEAQAGVASMHMLSEAEARMHAAERESKAVLIRAKANSEAQTISASGIKEEAAARGRAEAEVEGLRVQNTQRMLEAEASGMEAKAAALKKYNDAAMFLELSKLHIEAERDVHIDQAKAMGNALSQAQIRMYGGGSDGTVDTIRKMFTSGFSLGEVLEGVAQSLPAGLRDRFASNGIRGIFGRPGRGGQFREMANQLAQMVHDNFSSDKSRAVPFAQAFALLSDKATTEAQTQALTLLRDANEGGVFNEMPFNMVWTLLQATAKAAD